MLCSGSTCADHVDCEVVLKWDDEDVYHAVEQVEGDLARQSN